MTTAKEKAQLRSAAKRILSVGGRKPTQRQIDALAARVAKSLAARRKKRAKKTTKKRR